MMYSDPLSQLRPVLAQLFDNVSDAQIVASDAGLPIEYINFSGTAEHVWHAILEEAKKQELIDRIILIAIQRFPTNTALTNLLNHLPPQNSYSDQSTPLLQPLYYARSTLEELFKTESELRVACSTDFSEFAKQLKPNEQFSEVVAGLLNYCETRNAMEHFWAWLFKVRPNAYRLISKHKAQWDYVMRYNKQSIISDIEMELQPGIIDQVEQDPEHPLQSGDKRKIDEWFFDKLSEQEQSLAITVGLFGGMKLDYLVELSGTIEDWLFSPTKSQ